VALEALGGTAAGGAASAGDVADICAVACVGAGAGVPVCAAAALNVAPMIAAVIANPIIFVIIKNLFAAADKNNATA
jgi:hypothetical protein